jgi:tetratricopeptide (TPR) repeat protein
MRVAVLDHYRSSLTRMTHISERTGARLILVTPASNLGDFSPFKTEPSAGLSAADIRQVESLKLSASRALDEGNHGHALAISEQALALDDRDAELLYLQAQALRALGQMDEARGAFVEALDEDVCPLRALTPIPEIVTDIARTNNTGFVDFARIINERSPNGIPGSELFLDHVHPTIEGNRLLALALVEEMMHMGIVFPSATWDAVRIAEISERLESSLDEQAHAMALRNLSRVLLWAGKNDEAERLVDRTLTETPEDGESYWRKAILLRRAGDNEAALIAYREAARLLPLDATLRNALGQVLSQLGRLTEAREELESAIRMDRTLVTAHYDLGLVLKNLGEHRQAEAAYRRVLELDPNHADAHNNLGVIFAQRGDFVAAAELFARALRIDPNHGSASENLARARAAQRR